LKKLEKMGVRGTSLTWFKNYLSGRTQYVDINGTKSEALSLEISVIQGSILGPILFLCYINDFYTATALFSVLFADDTICLGNGKNLNELTAFVNAELKKIANWFRSNKMAVNTSKTKFIVFRTRGKRIDPRDCELVFNNNEIGKAEDPNLIFEIKRIHNEGDEKQLQPSSQTGRSPAPPLPWGQWASLRYTSFAGGRGSCGFQEHCVSCE
jgi:hypothetical protein